MPVFLFPLGSLSHFIYIARPFIIGRTKRQAGIEQTPALPSIKRRLFKESPPIGGAVSRRSSRGEVSTRNALFLSWNIEAKRKRNSFSNKALGLCTVFNWLRCP
jgi:hypothetical protein